MKKTVIIIFGILFSNAVAGTGGKVGLAFLKIPVDARAAAMGEAYCSISDDAAATYWNPAGLALAASNSIVLMHNAWLQDINHEYAAIQLFKGKHNIAFSLNVIHVSGIELRRQQASILPDGETSATNLSLGMGYATRIKEHWNIGIQLKYYYEKYYLAAAGGVGFDIGLIRKNIIKDLSWGLTVQNIGKMNNLNRESSPLPILIRSGLNYRLPWMLLKERPLVAADLLYVKNDIAQLNLGLEIAVVEGIYLRSGYIIGNDSHGLSAGFGVGYSPFKIAYAFVPFQYDLGNSHRFSFIFSF